ncbi:MAG TPA: hypothetical protein VNB22_12480 [Pyrinomonadaceae bacterium]|nr:hypothetical protein [Pyrinomonadaceae bacterium]
MGEETKKQTNWCWCAKCEGIFYLGTEWLSFCPAGGAHDEAFAKDFLYSVNTENKGEYNWFRCDKCQGLFNLLLLVWAGSNTPYMFNYGTCPAPGASIGGGHNPDFNVKYYIEKNNFSDQSLQTGWRFCKNCRGLYFGGHATQGKCPAGGAHTPLDNSNYCLFVK